MLGFIMAFHEKKRDLKGDIFEMGCYNEWTSWSDYVSVIQLL